MTISTENMRCFAEAARTLNFRMAARAVGLSATALSQRIQQLEGEVGAKLFHRTTRAVVLTEAGAALLPYAERAIEALEDCKRAASGRLGPPSMDLVLGTRHELGLSWIVPLLEDAERANPGLTLHLYFGSGPDLVTRVASVALDCAVTSSRIIDPRVEGIWLHDERYVFVGESALLAAEPMRGAPDAKQHTLFDTTDELPLFQYLRDALGGLDRLEFKKTVRLGTIAAMRHQVLLGKGLGVLPEYFVRSDLDAKKLSIALPDVQPQTDAFRLIIRTDDPRRKVLLNLAEFLRTQPLR